MRRSLLTLSMVIAGLMALMVYTGCGSDSSTGPDDGGDTNSLRPYIKNAKPGYVYTWAGVVNSIGQGVAGKGPEGLPPDETHLYWPQDVSFDATGMVYVLDWNNHRVLNLNSDGTFNNLIGGQFGDGPDGKADEIGLNHPTGLTFDPQGRLILAAWHNSIVKRMDLKDGMIYTICGIEGTNNRTYNGDEQPADLASLDLPVNVAFDNVGNMYIGDQGSMIIRKVDTNGVIHTVAGRPPEWHPSTEAQTFRDAGYCVAGNPDTDQIYVRFCGNRGDGGPAEDAEIFTDFGQAANPGGRICFDNMNNLYIADTSNNSVRRIDAVTGIITTYAGVGPNAWNYDVSHEGIPANQAPLFKPRDIACDGNGNVYIADTGHHIIRKVDINGIITTFAGLPGTAGHVGTEPRPAITDLDNGIYGARFNQPYGVEVGPDGNVWVADRNSNVIRVVIVE